MINARAIDAARPEREHVVGQRGSHLPSRHLLEFSRLTAPPRGTSESRGVQGSAARVKLTRCTTPHERTPAPPRQGRPV